MKKRFLFILSLFLFCFSLFAEGLTIEIPENINACKHTHYINGNIEVFTSYYVPEWKIPCLVTWTLTKKEATQSEETKVGRPSKFTLCDKLKLEGIELQKHSDYNNSGYDRGHWAMQFRDESCWGYGKTVMFIDTKYAEHDGGEWDEGQPTYSYGVDTIAGHRHGVGLCLDAGQDWTIPADAIDRAIDLCKDFLKSA